jgi:hypothetical protein
VRGTSIFPLLAALACAHAPPGAVGAREVELRPYAGRLRTLVAVVSGVPRRLLLDTGGGITLLTPEVAAASGCRLRGRHVGLRMSGERVEFGACGPLELEVAGLRLAPETGVFDLGRVLPPGLPPLSGLAALQTFDGQAITLDLGGGRLRVESPASLAARVAGLPPLPVRAAREMGGAGLDLFVRADARGGPLWLLLDSANLDDVLLAPHAAAALAEGPALAALQRGEEAEVVLPLPGLGAARVRARQRDLIYDGALNAELLERLVLTLDLERGRAWARWRRDALRVVAPERAGP